MRSFRGLIGRLVAVVATSVAVSTTVQAVEIVFEPWDWEITIQPTAGAADPVGPPVLLPVWGNAVVEFDDSGIPGGLGTQTQPQELPAGQVFTIPIEIVALSLTSSEPVPIPGTSDEFGGLEARLTPGTQALGAIQVENQGGILVGDSTIDAFVDLAFDEGGPNEMILTTDLNTPWNIGMAFDATTAIPAIDVFWLPSWFWLNNVPGSALPPPLLNVAGITNPWDVVVDVHGHITVPAPPSLMLVAGGLAGMLLTRRSRNPA